ncbi:MAG: hypothetical protein HC852_23155 [Acaryochloridaceae cyanobacterium RU_4_10]|nr:hypothetical protein [Acaryochloridaceae cyanobacterium RU_4_10]
MRKASCITFITTICLSIGSTAYAVSLHVPATVAMADERPLIPLEKAWSHGIKRVNLISLVWEWPTHLRLWPIPWFVACWWLTGREKLGILPP